MTEEELQQWLDLSFVFACKVTIFLEMLVLHCQNSPWANSKKTSLNGCSFLSPGRKVCLLILKEEGLKMMNPFVGRKKSCRMLSKRSFFPPLSDGR